MQSFTIPLCSNHITTWESRKDIPTCGYRCMTLLQPAGQRVNGKRNRCLSFLPTREHDSWRKNILLLTSMLGLYCEITLVFLFPSVLIQGYKTQRSGSLFTEAISVSLPDFQGKTSALHSSNPHAKQWTWFFRETLLMWSGVSAQRGRWVKLQRKSFINSVKGLY